MNNSQDEILIGLSEEITCPSDSGHRFPLRQGLAEATIRRMQEHISERRAKLEADLKAAWEAEFAKAHESKLQELNAELAVWRHKENQLLTEKETLAKEKSELQVQIAKQLAVERESIRKTVKEEEAERSQIRERTLKERVDEQMKLLEALNRQLSEKNKAEFDLEQRLTQLQAERELAIAQARDAARQEATIQAEKSLRTKFEMELETFRLKQAELEKQRDDARRSAEELKRRMEQGSQQIQGEVLELALEKELPVRFPADQIVPIGKGVHGADMLQTVVTPDGRVCGSITWETKNAQTWNSKWIEKLRNDMIANKSEFGVLVATILPEGVKHFDQVDGIWVCDLTAWLGLAGALRQQVVNLAFARASAEGRERKMDVLYRYLTGPEFRERVNAIVQTFIGMQDQLNREKRAITKHWSAREKQIQTVLDGLSGMYGDLQGIIGKASLPEIATLELEDTGEEDVGDDLSH